MILNETLGMKIFVMAYKQNMELHNMVNLNLVNKMLYATLIIHFQTMKSDAIINLLEKYNANGYYQKLGHDEANVPGILYDALSSGCDLPYVKSSQKVMDRVVELDIYQKI
jgi:hypothetical protein